MNDIFGRILTLFLAAAIFFGLPLVYMHERAKTARQLYLVTEVTHFVDSVANVGCIDREMINAFYDAVYQTNVHCDIALLHETIGYVRNEESGNYEAVSVYYDAADIFAELDDLGRDGKYQLSRGDFLRVTVTVYDDFPLVFCGTDATGSVTYGGSVKYENL